MIDVKRALVDLTKDRNGVPGIGTKHTGGLIRDWLLEREFGTWEYANSRRTILRRGDTRTDSEMRSTDFRREGVIPATSWRVVYKSFSASSRNSSGTDPEGPNTTDPYPTASPPKRSRIISPAPPSFPHPIPL